MISESRKRKFSFASFVPSLKEIRGYITSLVIPGSAVVKNGGLQPSQNSAGENNPTTAPVSTNTNNDTGNVAGIQAAENIVTKEKADSVDPEINEPDTKRTKLTEPENRISSQVDPNVEVDKADHELETPPQANVVESELHTIPAFYPEPRGVWTHPEFRSEMIIRDNCYCEPCEIDDQEDNDEELQLDGEEFEADSVSIEEEELESESDDEEEEDLESEVDDEDEELESEEDEEEEELESEEDEEEEELESEVDEEESELDEPEPEESDKEHDDE